MKIVLSDNEKWKIDKRLWQFCIGNDHAYQLHRKDVCEHIKEVHDECGFKYIRFHGIFDDDMLTYQSMHDFKAMRGLPHNKEITELNFRQVGDVYKNVLEAGYKPFVELSFMPSILAKGKKTGLRYLNNTCMPKSLKKWTEYITKFLEYLFAQFGKEEVETWYFEVWNEPDLKGFFNGSKKDYFKLYEVTAKAIKAFDEKLLVGGPATSACRWINDFKAFIKENNIPCDFISTHHYPGDAFGNMLTVKNALKMFGIFKKNAKNGAGVGETMKESFFYPEICKTWKKGIFNEMDANAIKEADDLPLFISEWNSMAVFGSPVHDEKYSSAFVIKTSLDLNDDLGGSSFWCASDIFEELIMLPKPFIGSYGIISNDGIPKPNFHAFKLLNMAYKYKLDKTITNDEVEYQFFKDDDGNLQLFVYSQDFTYGEEKDYNVEIEIKDIFNTINQARIDDDHCNPKKMWIEMGKPDNLTASEIKKIKEETALKFEDIEYNVIENKTYLNISLKNNDVVFISFKK